MLRNRVHLTTTNCYQLYKNIVIDIKPNYHFEDQYIDAKYILILLFSDNRSNESLLISIMIN